MADYYSARVPESAFWTLDSEVSSAHYLSDSFLALRELLGAVSLSTEADQLTWIDGTENFTVAQSYRVILQCRMNIFSLGVHIFYWNVVEKGHSNKNILFLFGC